MLCSKGKRERQKWKGSGARSLRWPRKDKEWVLSWRPGSEIIELRQRRLRNWRPKQKSLKKRAMLLPVNSRKRARRICCDFAGGAQVATAHLHPRMRKGQ